MSSSSPALIICRRCGTQFQERTYTPGTSKAVFLLWRGVCSDACRYGSSDTVTASNTLASSTDSSGSPSTSSTTGTTIITSPPVETKRWMLIVLLGSVSSSFQFSPPACDYLGRNLVIRLTALVRAAGPDSPAPLASVLHTMPSHERPKLEAAVKNLQASVCELVDATELRRFTTTWPLSQVYLSLWYSLSDMHGPAREAIQIYARYVESPSVPFDPVFLLASARALGVTSPEARSLLAAFAAFTVSTTWMTAAEKDISSRPLGSDGGMQQVSTTAVEEDPLVKRWKVLKIKSPMMDKFLAMTGLEEVKKQLMGVCEYYQTQLRMPVDTRDDLALNFSFAGNPGTGKTTAARCFAEVLHAVGARSKNVFVEVSASQLLREGPDKFQQHVKDASGGVLFIDEAHNLDAVSNPEGKRIVSDLVVITENQRETLTVIIAGYKDDLDAKFFAADDGLRRRFTTVPFEDYTAEQLRQIWDGMVAEKKWLVAQPLVSEVTIRRLARRIGTKGFGNAGAVRTVLESARRAATSRTGFDVQVPCLFIEDVLGPKPSRATNPALDAALIDLDRTIGLKDVKQAIHNLVDMYLRNYDKELKGEPVLDISLSQVFVGNPGTGKTTIAQIYGRVLKALQVLSDGSVELKRPSDLTGSVVGESETRTRALMNQTLGKVLVIDEAYVLDDALYGKKALDTLVGEFTGAAGEDRAVILCGYADKIDAMFKNQNPGLSSRFPTRLVFADYSDGELLDILRNSLKRNHLEVTADAPFAAVRELASQRKRLGYGNARSLESLLGVAKQRAFVRMSGSSPLVLSAEDFATPEAENALEAMQKMVNIEHITSLFDGIRKDVAVRRREGKSIASIVASLNFVITGNPGTGKTTVARHFAQVLFDMGLLPSNTCVETSGADLTGSVVGAAKEIVEKRLKEAWGGVLFIDEAHRLGLGPYGAEAQDKLVSFLTSVAEGKPLVVVAGYKRPMQEMLSRNEGFARRFGQRIDMPDWTADACVKLIESNARREGYTLETAALPILTQFFSELRIRPNWGNAGDVTTMFEKMCSARNQRVYEAVESSMTFTAHDVQQAADIFLRQRPPVDQSVVVSKARTYEDDEELSMAQASVTVAPVRRSMLEALKEEVEEKEETKRIAPEVIHEVTEATDEDREDQQISASLEEILMDEAPTGPDDDTVLGFLRGINVRLESDPVDTALVQKLADRTGMKNVVVVRSVRRQSKLLFPRYRESAGMLQARIDERERLRKLEEERKRLAEEAKKMAEAERAAAEARVREMQRQQEAARAAQQEVQRREKRLRQLSNCVMNYPFVKVPGGYKCTGGSHFVSDAQL